MVVVLHNPRAVTAPIHTVGWFSLAGYSLAAAQFSTLNHNLLDVSQIWRQNDLIMFSATKLNEATQGTYIHTMHSRKSVILIFTILIKLTKHRLCSWPTLLQSLLHFSFFTYVFVWAWTPWCVRGLQKDSSSLAPHSEQSSPLPFHIFMSKSIKGYCKDMPSHWETLFITAKKKKVNILYITCWLPFISELSGLRKK